MNKDEEDFGATVIAETLGKCKDYIEYVHGKIDIEEIPMKFEEFLQAEKDLSEHDTKL